MSEAVSYSNTVMDRSSGVRMREALKSRGVFFHDDKAWEAARKRMERMEQNLKRELESSEKMTIAEQGPEEQHREVFRARAMLNAFSKVHAFREYAMQKKLQDFQGISEEIGRLNRISEGQGSKKLEEAARVAQKRLEQFASKVQNELCQVEREVMLDTVSATLRELDYVVEIKGSALKGISGRSCIWAEADSFGELSMDFSGFSGISCIKEVSRVEDRLKCNGLSLRRSSSKPHGKPEGDSLSRKLRPIFPEFKKIGSTVNRHVRIKPKTHRRIRSYET